MSAEGGPHQKQVLLGFDALWANSDVVCRMLATFRHESGVAPTPCTAFGGRRSQRRPASCTFSECRPSKVESNRDWADIAGGRTKQTPGKLDRTRPRLTWSRPNVVLFRPKLDRTRPMLGRIWQHSVESGLVSRTVGRIPADIGPSSTKFGGTLCQSRSNLARSRPRLGRIRPKLGRSRSTFGQIRPELGRSWRREDSHQLVVRSSYSVNRGKQPVSASC